MAKICTAAAALTLLLLFCVPSSADGGSWRHGKVHKPFGRIYLAYPWGYPVRHHLYWKYPMFGEWTNGVRRYYFQLPPYWDCCW